MVRNILGRLLFLSTVGRKIFVAITGLFLVGFLLIHLAGNITLFFGPDAFNGYAYQLEKNKAILYTLEIILLIGFSSHIIQAIYVTLENKKSRPVSYKKRRTLGMSTIFSNNMALGGSLILIFLVLHVNAFRFGETEMVYHPSADELVRDIYTLVTTSFKDPIYSGFYILAMFFVGGHVSHGFQSAFRSLGLSDKRVYPFFKKLSYVIGFFVALGFATMPIYFGFFH